MRKFANWKILFIKIENTKNDIEKDFALIKDKIGLTSADLDWYSNFKEDLEKEDMSVEDIPFLNNKNDKKIYHQKSIWNFIKN